MKKTPYSILFIALTSFSLSNELLIEAESFKNKGGWVVDQQFMDIMGSPYLMAHGLGKPVMDASTDIQIPQKGLYHVFVRTYNWTAPWTDKAGPGKFLLSIKGKTLSAELGNSGKSWIWQKAGSIELDKGLTSIALKDLTGFNGRCDAIYISTEDTPPPNSIEKLEPIRKKNISVETIEKPYDLIVVGGGIAGMSAAITASRLGCKVALINDRPILGGNNSSEIRVHLGGRIDIGPYPKLGGLQKEWGPTKIGNAGPASNYEDAKKEQAIATESNISLYSSYRLINTETHDNKIKNVTIKHIETGKEITLNAPLYTDCTGDGTLGALAGAEFKMGRESRAEFNESRAPEKADKMTMGSSVQWNTQVSSEPTSFPEFNYGINIDDTNKEKVTMGEWDWETGMELDQLKDFEKIRDYGLLVVFSNWSYLKNKLKENNDYSHRRLDWVAYIAGKRESRRLIGDHILTENDLTDYIEYEDGTGCTTWSIDLHYPDEKNAKQFPTGAFKSIAKHTVIHPYPIPYRCFYSKNIDNLFMAGRNISVTHVALGTVRVMRTTGIMGEVVGMAAFLCKKYNSEPRAIYTSYLHELKMLMKAGIGGQGLPNNQKYNMGGTLPQKPTPAKKP